MSKICDICGRGPVTGNNVSHSKRHTRRRYLINLVSKRFGPAKLKICTHCLRTIKRAKRELTTAEATASTSSSVAA